jgi:polygalacturonase
MRAIRRRQFLRTAAAAAFGACGRGWAARLAHDDDSRRPEQSGWDMVPGILASIVPPQFPDRDFLITSYGISPGSLDNCAPAIQAAIAACNRAGGGRVVVPAGPWQCGGPIQLLSNVNLYLENGANIAFGTNPEDYLPVKFVRWQGIRCYNYSPLIYAFQEENIAITGSGALNGQGVQGWDPWANLEDPDWARLQQMAENNVPVESRVFGAGHYMRPGFIEFYYCQNILIQGINISNSPFWTIHPTFCTNVTVQEVSVTPGATNDDGCDPDSCTNVLIEGCNFDTSDDNISIKAGLLPDAAGQGACQNIVVQNCNCLRSAWSGLTIGSQLGGAVRNVFMQNCAVSNVVSAHYIKAYSNLGGSVENIYVRSNRAYTCNSLLTLQPDAYTDAGSYGPPTYQNINMEDVICTNCIGTALHLLGDERKPVRGVYLSDIAIHGNPANGPDQVFAVEGLFATGITYNGALVSL